MAPHNFDIPVENRKSDQDDCQSPFTDGNLTPNTMSSTDTLSSDSDHSPSSTSREVYTYSPVTIPTVTTLQQILIEAADTDDLDSVKEIEFQIQDEDLSLQKLSTFLPNLYKINLYGSIIKSVRALGSDLENLKILNIGKCNLVSLDGLMGLPNLEELQAESNFIEDVGPCAFTSKIKTLNLNNNKVADIQCVGFLSLCLELRHIYLEGCPVSTVPDYRRIIKYLLPQLISLDGQSYGVAGSNSMFVNETQLDENLKKPSTPRQEIRKINSSETQILSSRSTTLRHQHPSSFLRKSNSFTRKSYDMNEILNVSKHDPETTLDPHNLKRNVVKLPPLKNTRIILTPFDNRPATTSVVPSSTKMINDLDPRPSTSRAFSQKDYIADLETVKNELKKLPTLCNPFSGDIFEAIAKLDENVLQLNESNNDDDYDWQTLLSTSRQWRARSALYRSQLYKF